MDSERIGMEERMEVADIYVRVSTMEQAEKGYSISEQECKLTSYCEAVGYRINKVVKDPGYSGSNLDRPGIQEVMQDARQKKITRVVVWKLDRLSRSQKDTLTLLEDVFTPNGVSFVSMSESFDTGSPIGRCIVGVLSAFAQMERENIKNRTAMGRQAALKAGKAPGGNVPIGYVRIGTGELGVDPLRAQLVRDLFGMVAAGSPISTAYRQVLRRYGLPDVSTQVAGVAGGRIIRNPVYAGMRQVGGEEYGTACEALVSREDWEAANRAVRARSTAPRVKRGILGGIIYCARCGARMVRRRYRDGDFRYFCYSVEKSSPMMVRDPNCDNRTTWKAVDLEALVVGEVARLQADPAAIREAASSDVAPNATSPIRDRLAEIEKQLSRLLSLYQSGVMELDELSPRIADLKREREQLSRSLSELEEAERMKPAQAEGILKGFAPILQASEEDKRACILALIDRVEVYRGEVTIRWKFA